MAYRPSPAEFPTLLVQVPAAEHNADKRSSAILLLIVGFVPVLLSVAYARDMIMTDEAHLLWKPAIAFVVGVLILLLAIHSLKNGAVIVRREGFVAVYQRGIRQQVFAIGQITVIKLSILKTIRLWFASIMATLGGGGGLILYVHFSRDPTFIGVAWFVSVLFMGVAILIDCIFGRSGGAVVQIGGMTRELRRPI